MKTVLLILTKDIAAARLALDPGKTPGNALSVTIARGYGVTIDFVGIISEKKNQEYASWWVTSQSSQKRKGFVYGYGLRVFNTCR